MTDHASGKGSGYTKETRPIALVWYESHGSREGAAAREHQLKGWNHRKKQDLAEGRITFQGSARRVHIALG